MKPASLLFVASLLHVAAPAQDQATTLLAMGRAAAVVVRAQVLAAEDPSPEWHVMRFSTVEVLKGTVGAQFVLREGAGACCGHSLFAMQPGDRCLLFLARTGPLLHPFGGARGVLADETPVVMHVRELLAATSDAQRAPLLVRGLQHEAPRVRDDAAHALAGLPQLQLSASDRATAAATLASLLQQRSTAAAPLVQALVRLRGQALDDLLPLYLTLERDDQAALLRDALVRAPAGLVTERLPMFSGGQGTAPLRAAELLAELPADAAAPGLRILLRSTDSPHAQLRAAEALLAAGVPDTEIAPFVPAAVMRLANRRRHDVPAFRSITPRPGTRRPTASRQR